MVRLSKQQEQLIAKLKDAREALNRTVNAIDAEARVKREQAKQPVAEVVAEALAAGIPARQVALRGLGYADVSSLKQYTMPNNAALVNTVVHLERTRRPQQPARAAWSETNDTDSDWPSIDVIDTDGTFLKMVVDIDRRVTDRTVISPNNGWYKYKGETKAEVQTAIIEFLTEQFGKPIEWE